MTTYWDFSTILSVDPTRDTCAADAKSRYRRCKNSLNPDKRHKAPKLLSEMDRTKVVSSELFTALAEEMLCANIHNSPNFPVHNQVQKVSAKWQAIFLDYAERKKQKGEKLKRTPSIVRQFLETQALQDDLQTAKTVSEVLLSKNKVYSPVHATRTNDSLL